MNNFDMFGDEPPKTRNDCECNTRPCPWIRCKHHMIWAEPTQLITKMDDDELCDKLLSYKQTCVLDVADQGGATLEDIGEILGITRERVRQIEGNSNKKSILKGISLLRKSPSRMRWLTSVRNAEY